MIVTGESTNLPSATSSRKRREAQLAYDDMDKFDREKYAKTWGRVDQNRQKTLTLEPILESELGLTRFWKILEK